MFAVYATRAKPLTGYFAKPGATALEWYLVGKFPTQTSADAEREYQVWAFGNHARVVPA
jgi:hypothetical protein